MRVGVYDPYLDDLGGGEKYMMTLAVCLSQDNDVDVFWDNLDDLDKLQKRFNIDFTKINISPNVFSPKFPMIKRLFATKKYDAIFFLSDGSIPFVASKKLFIHIQQPLSKLQNDSFISKIKLSRVTSFFCNSEYTKSFIDKKLPVRSKIIYPPVDLFPKKINKENVILHVGRFRVVDPVTRSDDYKKQHFMIKTFKKIINKGLKNWKLILAISVKDAEKEQFDEMKKNTKDYPIEFLINQTNGELWEAYNNAKIYWHASGFGEDLIKHPELAEHFGISTVEAMGAGDVPIVIDAGGQKEIVESEKNGLLWSTAEEFEEKTLRLIKDKNLWNRLSENAQKRAKDFSKEIFCKEANSLLK